MFSLKFAFLLLLLAILFPKFGMFLIQRLTAFLPLLNALMPCVIIVAGIYLLIKSVLK